MTKKHRIVIIASKEISLYIAAMVFVFQEHDSLALQATIRHLPKAYTLVKLFSALGIELMGEKKVKIMIKKKDAGEEKVEATEILLEKIPALKR